MGKSQRDKGNRGEVEARAVLDGLTLLEPCRKLSGMYVEGPDIEWLGLDVEVKRRNTNRGFAFVDNLLSDPNNDMAMVRADRGEWVIAFRPEGLARLFEAVAGVNPLLLEQRSSE
jgi:hypothetical protein